MRKGIRYIAGVCALVLLATVLGACGKSAKTTLPDVLRGQSFIYDETEDGSGDGLYTLRFTDTGCLLHTDDGIVYRGDVTANADKTLLFSGKNAPANGTYTGGAFEELSVTLTFGGRTLQFAKATETTEDVYLPYLGTFSGSVDGKDAVLILERWFEWYLYTDSALTRGTYEIFADGTIELSPQNGKTISGTLEQSPDVRISFKQNGKTCFFTAAQPLETYDAAHAMGTYTLSLYPVGVFTIRGVDGFLKAMGTLDMDGEAGTAQYFPRAITGDVETDYAVQISKNEDTYYFPQTTPLLPRSGNINAQTGLGSYWNAGTKLEFIRAVSKAETLDVQAVFPKAAVSGTHHLPQGDYGLRQVMPSLGTAKPLALLIDFPDFHHPRHVTAEGVQNALFSLEDANSLSAYYYLSSYGKLTIDGTVLGWYRTKQSRSTYDSDSEIMAEAINYYIDNNELRLEDYDADGDGAVDALFVLWAGNMESGIWDSAYRSTWTHSPDVWSRKVTGYIFVPGSTIWSSAPPLRCNTNSLVHETGHLLGLNDYYSYDTPDRALSADTVYTGGALEGGLGGMDMMDANIGDHNVFSKWLLGWAEPTVIEYADIPSLSGQTVRLRPSSRAGDAIFVKLRESGDLYTELLVIEAVMPELNAAEYTRLTEPVVRILHVENTLAQEGVSGSRRGFGFQFDNSYTSTKYIGILEADGQDDVLHFAPAMDGEKLSYDPADYFKAGDAITPDTYPNTNAYDAYGNASVPTGLCIAVDRIDADGTATVRLSYAKAQDRLQIKSVMPEPCVVPYAGDATTIPAGTKQIRVTFDRSVQWVKKDAVRVLSGHSVHTPLDVQTALSGETMTVTFDKPLKSGDTFTLVIPANCIRSAEEAGVKNNFNSIYGFIVK